MTSETQNIEQFWKKVLGILQTELNPMMYNTWVMKVIPENLTEASIDLVVEVDYAKKQLQKYISLIEDAVQRVGGKNREINFVVRKSQKPISLEDKEIGPLFKPEKKNLENKKLSTKDFLKSGLSPQFTFDTFIIGNSNQLAFAVAQAISENPGVSYNPFFLYSNVGLGKTHLVQAIGNKVLQEDPSKNVLYTTGEAFMNELIEAIQSGSRGKYETYKFRDKYRKVDVLIIDDIQFIIGRESTQMEFFHTFNTLYMAEKQIILTSDRPPKEFTNLEKRITSRFGSGIIADIQNPDADLRTAILRTKRDQRKETMPNDVIDFIAQNVDSNIRELEGAYLQVITMAKAQGIEPTVDIAQGILGKNGSIGRKKSVSNNDILKAVCKYYSLKLTDIKGKRRNKEIVIPRQVAMYLMREITETPLMTIGDHLGGRDHTTIMHGVEKIEEKILEMGKIQQDVINVKQLL